MIIVTCFLEVRNSLSSGCHSSSVRWTQEHPGNEYSNSDWLTTSKYRVHHSKKLWQFEDTVHFSSLTVQLCLGKILAAVLILARICRNGTSKGSLQNCRTQYQNQNIFLLVPGKYKRLFVFKLIIFIHHLIEQI